ncbi:hypothetical protein AB1Y20_021880 [Prymnesium parvum]|uniref:Uncharacterized protein n=1 Tax=Prymnesium parvum TaxID=97485 RepID=A0AB34JH75_PRYPA
MRDGVICLATLLDTSRLHALIRLANAWQGAIAASVLGKPPSSNTSLRRQHRDAAAALRGISLRDPRVRVVLVDNPGFDCPPRFPFNLLRNVALSLCVEPFVLALDIDFVPLPLRTAYSTLRAISSTLPLHSNRAVVLPAFDLVRDQPDDETTDVPDKRHVAQMLRSGALVPFGAAGGMREVWPAGHSCETSPH